VDLAPGAPHGFLHLQAHFVVVFGAAACVEQEVARRVELLHLLGGRGAFVGRLAVGMDFGGAAAVGRADFVRGGSQRDAEEVVRVEHEP